MKTVQKLSLLALAILVAGCNEKVSPELQQGNTTTTPDNSGGPTIVPDEYFIKVVNTAPTILNYKLHKTGAGNYNKACEVRSTTKLSNTMYQADLASNDITCFLEAEELALYYGGLSFQVESSPNTCEYLAYSPYSYYNFQPGSSTSTYLEVIKGNDDTTAAHLTDASTRAAIVASGIDLDYTPRGGAPTDVTFDQTISETIDDAARQPFPVVDNDAKYCRFNYTVQYEDDKAPNCDEGTVTVRKLVVTFDKSKAESAAASAADVAGDAARAAAEAAATATYSTVGAPAGINDGLATISTAEQADITAQGDAAYTANYNATYAATYAAYDATFKVTNRTVKCGGKIVNCVEGPIKKHSNLTGVRGTIYTQTEFDKAGKTEKYEYPTLFPNRAGTFIYSNYRRDLANPFIVYGATDENDPIYTGAFASALFGRTFEPNLMERYSRNQNWDKTTMIDGATLDTYSDAFDQLYGVPFAAEPYVGMAYASYVNPYYTFYCLDNAYDIKARIRMVVRDWDRINTNDSSIELLSDIGTIDARMDVQSDAVEDPDSADDYNAFNDQQDWDDIIRMQRDPIFPYIYRPEPVSVINTGVEDGYPLGYFNPAWFPEEIKSN